MRAKLIDGALVYAPKVVPNTVNGCSVNTWNPSDELLAEQGWKAIRTTEPPEAPAGYHYEPTYSDEVDEILQDWILVQDSDEISDAEAIDIIMGVNA